MPLSPTPVPILAVGFAVVCKLGHYRICLPIASAVCSRHNPRLQETKDAEDDFFLDFGVMPVTCRGGGATACRQPDDGMAESGRRLGRDALLAADHDQQIE